MREENELNVELTAQQSEIESTMASVELPESAIDQNVLMYQAGWSAAMAECKRLTESQRLSEANRSTDVKHGLRKSRFSAWPAIAATFAATTAVCVVLLMEGPGDGPTVESAANQVASVETKIEPLNESTSVIGNTREVTKETQLVRGASGFGLAKLFGISADQFVLQRDAQIQKLLVETASPSRDVSTVDDDEDFEPWVPLTPRSSISFSL